MEVCLSQRLRRSRLPPVTRVVFLHRCLFILPISTIPSVGCSAQNPAQSTATSSRVIWSTAMQSDDIGAANRSNDALRANQSGNSSLTVNDLPPEILARIFLMCLSSTPLLPDKKQAPLLFCNVCSYWRCVAITTPTLWSCIKVVVPTLKKGEKWPGIIAFSTWVERSGASPLSLSLRLDNTPSQLPNLLKLVIPHISRWKSFAFDCTFSMSNNQNYPGIPSEGAATLESVDISLGPLSNAGNAKLWEWFCMIFDHSPRLHTITSAHVPARFPWFQIRHVNFYHRARLHVSQCRQILGQASSLESANLFVAREAFAELPLSPLRHDLRRLRLVSYFPLAPFLNCLTLPALRELSFKYSYDEPVPWVAWTGPISRTICDLFTRSACRLVKLSLTVNIMVEHERIDILKHASVNATLVELSISGCDFPLHNALFEYLTVKEGVPCALPKLANLSFRTLISAEDGVVSQMAMSRCVGRATSTSVGAAAGATVVFADQPCQLIRLGLPFTEKLSQLERPLDISRLNELARSGLCVSFETV